MDIRAIFLGIAFSFMWSSAFTSARFIVADAPPFTALAIRFLISGAIALIIAYSIGEKFRLTRAQLWATILFGICQNGLYLGLNFYAMQTIDASIAVIIASTMPLLVALFGWLVLREKLRPMGVLGLLAGFLGVAIIMATRVQNPAETDLFGVGLCVLGAVALTVATLALRGATSGGNFVFIMGVQMLVGSAALALPAMILETFAVNWTWSFAWAFAYTTLFPGLTATFVWFILVNRIGTVRASTFHFLNPFLGVSVAALLLSEKLGPTDVIGVAVVALGILAVQMSKIRS
jgi:drug/metabolite transporter (DMT)-like permease